MEKCGKVEVSDDFLDTELAQSIVKHDSDLTLRCLQRGESPHVRCNKTESSLLHLVSMTVNCLEELAVVPVVYLLSNAGLDLDVVDKNDFTPLQLAIKSGLLEVMTALMKCGAQCRGNERQLAIRYGGFFHSEFLATLRMLSPDYWEAVKSGNTFRVNKLVKSWCRVNVARHGTTLIEFAKQLSANQKLIRHLVDNEASIELAHAVMAGDETRAKFLLCNHSVDLKTMDLSHKGSLLTTFSPLTLHGAALKYGHSHVLSVLSIAQANSKTVMSVDFIDREKHRLTTDIDKHLENIVVQIAKSQPVQSSICVVF